MNWEDLLPSIVVIPPFIPLALIVTGGFPFIAVQSAPKSFNDSNNGAIGLFIMLESPDNTISPSFANAAIDVISLIVVPEFFTSISSFGAIGVPSDLMLILDPVCSISAPNAIQLSIVAFVSNDVNGLFIVDLPFDNNPTARAVSYTNLRAHET